MAPKSTIAAIIAPVPHFRLILSPPANGARNMALDESILESVAAGDSPPTLRFYAWDPACLSLGYAQSIDDVDRAGLQKAGWELVRRPTGGKAILHTDELTYAIAGPADHPLLKDGVLASYQRLSAGLLAALQRFDLRPEIHASSAASNGNNPICFQDPGAFELTVRGMKLLGSAQLRRAQGVLQHGSLPLVGDIGRICWALSYQDEMARQQAAAALRRHATTLERATGEPVEWQAAAEAMAHGFRIALRLELDQGEPTAAELARAEQLVGEKYANPEWNQRL